MGCPMGGKGLPVATHVGNLLGSPVLWGLLGGLDRWLPTWGSPSGSPVPVPVGWWGSPLGRHSTYLLCGFGLALVFAVGAP